MPRLQRLPVEHTTICVIRTTDRHGSFVLVTRVTIMPRVLSSFASLGVGEVGVLHVEGGKNCPWMLDMDSLMFDGGYIYIYGIHIVYINNKYTYIYIYIGSSSISSIV